jgi:hypothetical protein
MARTALTVTPIVRTGVALAASAANVDGHSVPNDERTFIYVNNGSGGSINVTIPSTKTVDGLAVPNRVVAVPAGQNRLIGPFLGEVSNQPDGSVHVNFSAVTSVTVAAFRI